MVIAQSGMQDIKDAKKYILNNGVSLKVGWKL